LKLGKCCAMMRPSSSSQKLARILSPAVVGRAVDYDKMKTSMNTAGHYYSDISRRKAELCAARRHIHELNAGSRPAEIQAVIRASARRGAPMELERSIGKRKTI